MTTRRDLIAGAGLAALALGLGAGSALAQASAPAKPPLLPIVREFYVAPATADFALSPNGRRIAVLHNKYSDRGIESWIELVDAANPTAAPKVLKLGDQEARSVLWANDTRLLVWMDYDVTRKGYETEYIRRVIGLNEDGSAPAVMFGNRGTSLEYIHDLGAMIDPLPDDPNNVLMFAWEPLRGMPGLFKVDVNSGQATLLEYGDLRTFSWLTQNGVPMIRLDADRRDDVTHIMARAPGEADWKAVRTVRTDQFHEFKVCTPTETPGVFLVLARKADEDKISVRELNLKTLEMGPPKFAAPSVDMADVWVDQRRKLMAASWADDRTAYDFVDKGFAPHYAAMQKYFGPDRSILMREVDDARTKYLAVATGSQEPATFFLYDRTSHAITELGRSMPHLTPERLGRMSPLEVRTRDGAQIRAYLTQPASGAPGPLVVFPHGGPELRDDYGFDVWSQALAAQGWWVLQVNFRGSGGYGEAFAEAGWKRWGERMQEDVEDALAQAIEAHKLDAGRVAILGGSYGGYAALMGGVRRPDLYKAVVSIAGVSDLADMLRWERAQDGTSNKDHYEFWRKRIGDPEADAEMLAKASPRRRVAEFKAPVFLAHGILDGTVPVDQSRAMAKALTAAGKKVEYWEIRKEGHQASTPALDRERLDRAIAFLKPLLA